MSMRIIYLPLSQYKINEIQRDRDDEPNPYSTRVWDILIHLDRFPIKKINFNPDKAEVRSLCTKLMKLYEK